jgi:hypothetical protein
MNIKLKYVSRERSGLFLYHRVIPLDLREHYCGQRLHRQSLQTHDPGEAAREALRLARVDDEIWEALRNGAYDIEAAKEAIRLRADDTAIRRFLKSRAGPPEHTFSEALTLYFTKHHPDTSRSIIQGRGRSLSLMSIVSSTSPRASSEILR